MKKTVVGIGVLALGIALMTGCRNTAIVYDDAARAASGARAEGSLNLVSVRMKTPYSAERGRSIFAAMGQIVVDGTNSVNQTQKPRTAGERLSDWLVFESPDGGVFTNKVAGADTARTPVKIVVQGQTQDNESWGAGLNNLLSFCTLAIWPAYGSELCTYTVEAEVAGQKRTKTFSIEERRLTSWLPTGLIPVPAWADSRGKVRQIDQAEEDKVHEVVLSLFSKP